MITACESHIKAPPVRTPQNARVVARDIIVRYPSLVPEVMWDSSYPEKACCTRGALAYSLVHAAIRRALA